MDFGTKGCMYCTGSCNKECLKQEKTKQKKPIQETLEKFVERVAKLKYGSTIYDLEKIDAFKDGAKWQAERMYSEEDMIEFNEWVSLNFPNQHNYLRALQKYNQGLDVPKEHLVGYCSTKELLDKFKKK